VCHAPFAISPKLGHVLKSIKFEFAMADQPVRACKVVCLRDTRLGVSSNNYRP
jgi:hypothetical protein